MIRWLAATAASHFTQIFFEKIEGNVVVFISTVRLTISIILALFCTNSLADSPALWKISDEDTSIHIFGSVHVLKPGTIWLTDDLQEIVSNANSIYMEVSAQQRSSAILQPLFSQFGVLPEGDVLKNHMPVELYESLASEFNAMGMQEQIYAQFKPWMAGTIYTSFRFMRLGYNPAAGVEASLVSLARAQGKSIEGFETAAFQVDLLSQMTGDQQIALLDRSLIYKDRLEAYMAEMTSAWTRGDLDALEIIFDRAVEKAPELKERLLTSRNRNWVKRIQEILDRPGNYLVAVGTAHLVGDQSLFQFLDEASITVTRIH